MGFGDRVGDDLAPQKLAEGDAHILPQHPGIGGHGGDIVVGRNFLQQPVVNDVGGQGKHQTAGVQLRQGHLQPPVAPPDGGEHPGIVAQGLLNGGRQILYEDRGGVHIHLPDGGGALLGHKALAGQHILQLGRELAVVGQKDGVDALLLRPGPAAR